MSSMDRRLQKLEKARGKTTGCFVFIYRDAEPAGAVVGPVHYRTADGRLSWGRAASETADDFKRRVTDMASHRSGSQVLIMLPDNGRGE